MGFDQARQTFDNAYLAYIEANAALKEAALAELLRRLPADAEGVTYEATDEVLYVRTPDGVAKHDDPDDSSGLLTPAGYVDWFHLSEYGSEGGRWLDVRLMRLVIIDGVPLEWALAHCNSQAMP